MCIRDSNEMADHDALGAYCNDHRAGATAVVNLLERLAAAEHTIVARTDLDELRRSIEDELARLEEFMDRRGITRDPTRVAAGWVGEKASRLRLSEVVTGSSAVSQLLELETVAVGIQGKQCLWQALRAAGVDGDELDLDELLRRAHDQAEQVEGWRRAAADAALSTS